MTLSLLIDAKDGKFLKEMESRPYSISCAGSGASCCDKEEADLPQIHLSGGRFGPASGHELRAADVSSAR